MPTSAIVSWEGYSAPSLPRCGTREHAYHNCPFLLRLGYHNVGLGQGPLQLRRNDQPPSLFHSRDGRLEFTNGCFTARYEQVGQRLPYLKFLTQASPHLELGAKRLECVLFDANWNNAGAIICVRSFVADTTITANMPAQNIILDDEGVGAWLNPAPSPNISTP